MLSTTGSNAERIYGHIYISVDKSERLALVKIQTGKVKTAEMPFLRAVIMYRMNDHKHNTMQVLENWGEQMSTECK
jgi:hypothetical protein